MFDKHTFVEFSVIRKKYEIVYISRQEKDEALLRQKETFQYSPLLLSIPLINFIGLFYRHTQEQSRIYNGIILSCILI